MKFNLLLLLVALLLPSASSFSQEAANHSPSWQALIDESTIAVAKVDVADLKDADLGQFSDFTPASRDTIFVQAYHCLRIAQAADADHAFVIASLADRLNDMPLLVLQFDGDRPTADQAKEKIGGEVLGTREIVQHSEHDLLLVGSKQQLERIESIQPVENPVWQEAFSAVSDNSIQIAVYLNDDSKLVIGQVFDAVPSAVVENFRWAAAGVDLTQAGKITFRVQQKNHASAEQCLEFLTRKTEAPKREELDAEARIGIAPIEWAMAGFSELLSWQVEDNAVVATLEQSATATVKLRENFITDVYTANSLNKLEQLGLACFNYHDAYNRFPDAFPAPENKTKLGWRVAILPFIERNDLYQKFHHDEPWDSEHNLSLVDQMPDLFYLPGSRWKRSEGKTCIQAPVGKDRMFFKPGMNFGEMIDGSSNTIMLIESNDDNAQIWTRPDGIEIPLDDPLSVLGGHYKDDILFLRADGSYDPKSRHADLRVWKAMLTPQGKENVWETQ